ncbi:indole-3-glycerol-phosphate synthase [Methanococcoides burtonii]|uniref:Indole-3-glycerol phosphate synthase n=1 Tax=Methanococcoides burtonii (strain DSM 6242 / NBRC 107633 / OCM 468 / ACE-M) TaxID=259564 RepID=Q12ZK1_METBU|nr:indole-3-glycerol-phosphate synthase [Methanococcoides burtonii]ABE51125.1 Indole-3-glycerol phosphate synthase [Methanococcoides burtonii DSM 6242]
MHSAIHEIINSTEKRVKALYEAEDHPILKGDTQGIEKIIEAIHSKKDSGKVPIIAEVKPASPSMKIMDISPEEAGKIAMDMENAGAIAISVLTEPEFFEGSIDNLKAVREAISLPVLRKDFIIDKVQFDEVRSDLILLIAGLLGEKLEELIEYARSKEFEPLVEVHNKEELTYVLENSSAKIVGINNRDLTTLEVDIATTEELIPIIKKYDRRTGEEHLVISESGVHTPEDARRMMRAGADAILIGTSIVKDEDIYRKTKELVDALDNTIE